MGYLDNSSITVDAVLTKKGRELLKDSGAVGADGVPVGGGLNITSFTLSDTGVDYSLFNTSHPSGSAFYGEAIENLPMLEASVHAEYNLRNRLITLDQFATAVPALIFGGLDTTGGSVLTFKEKEGSNGVVNVDIVGLSNSVVNSNLKYQYYYVIQDPSVVTGGSGDFVSNLSGTTREFLQEEDIPFAHEYGFNGTSFRLDAVQQDTKGRQTNIYVVHIPTGAYNSFKVVNNVTTNKRAILATNIKGTI